MTDVFISYKRRLRPRVEEIAVALRALGLTVWYDASLEAGSSFSAEISAEVRSAGCVLVCWSDDAFPHGGDRSGWVVGEATIGHDRQRLVPVLLERAELDPPWNTIHTEDLSDWTPAQSDHPGWRGMLAAIGRHVGRDFGAATDAVVAPSPAPSGASLIIAALAGAVLTAIGAALLAQLDPNLAGGWYELAFGVVLAALPLAITLWRSGRLSPGRAALLVLAFLVAFGVGVGFGILAILAILAILPIRADAARYDLAEMIVCALGGFAGAGISLGALPLLGVAANTRATWLRILGASVVLSAVAAVIAALPFFNLEISNSAVIWLGAVWQLAYAPLLGWVVRRR